MKNLFLLLFAAFLGFGVQAQDAEKDLKSAKKLLASYKLDNEKTDDLAEAGGLVEAVLNDSELGKDYKALAIVAEVYENQMTSDQAKLQFNQIQEPRFPMAASKAYKTYKKAFMVAEKKYQTKEALDGMSKSSLFLNNIGFGLYESGDAAGALTYFEQYLEADKLLKENGQDGLLTTDSLYQNQIFISSAMATSSGQTDKAEMYLNELVSLDYRDPLVYSNLYALYKDSDKDKAITYLDQGRAAFPDDINLLFSEINYYLSEGRLEELIDKLKAAIAAEPENASVRSTLGSVYDQLYQKANTAGNQADADKYFKESEMAYAEALELDPDASEVNYSLGALYYNRAVIYISEMNELAEDYSKEGTKTYEAKKAQAMAEFDRALPYFTKAYEANKEDRNTLIALKEIYARKDMFDKSNEMKTQLEALGG